MALSSLSGLVAVIDVETTGDRLIAEAGAELKVGKARGI